MTAKKTPAPKKAPAPLDRLHQPIDDVKAPEPDDVRMWSVTTLIGALDKPALVYWSAERTAIAAIREAKAWQARLANEGEDSAIEYLKQSRFRPPRGERGAAELGSAVHEAIEQYTLTGNRPEVDDELAPYLNQFDRWAQEFQPEYQATEVTVLNPDRGYAGTCDGFFTIGGVPLIFDIKTSKKSFDKKGKPTGPYPEVGLQLAAYRYAPLAAIWRPRRFEKFRRRYYLLSEAERAMAVPVPTVEGGIALHITPGHCHAWPIQCGPDIFEAFLYVIEAARFTFETSKRVVGAQPLERIVE